MTPTQTARSTSIARFLADLADDERQAAQEGLHRLWRQAAIAADPDAIDPDKAELAQIRADLELCGMKPGQFRANVTDLQTLRELRRDADVDAAAQQKGRLQAQAAQKREEAETLRSAAEKLEHQARELAGQADGVFQRAHLKRRAHQELAAGLMQRGGHYLAEVSEPLIVAGEDMRPTARVRVLQPCWRCLGGHGEFLRPGTVIEARPEQADIDSGVFEFISWLHDTDEPAPEPSGREIPASGRDAVIT